MAKPVVLTQPYEIVVRKPSGLARFCVRANNLDASSKMKLAPASYTLHDQDGTKWSKGVIRVKAKYTGGFSIMTVEADQITITVTNTDMMGTATPSDPVTVPVFVDDSADPP